MLPEIWFVNLGIKIQKLDRIAFSVFGIDIYWYGILIVLGILGGSLITAYEIKRTKQDINLYLDFLAYAILGSLLCARIYYIVFSWDYFKNNLDQIFAIRNGGIAIYGAIIGGFITAIIYTKVKKISFLKFTDSIAMGLLVGQIIGRFGNFVNREAFGGYTDSIFALRYLKSQVSNLTQDVLNNVVNVNGTEYIQVHPTFLYEAFWNFCILIFILFYRKNKKFEGELTFIYFLLYGIGRFIIEGLRTDSLMIYGTNLRVSQVLSLLFSIIALIFLVLKRRKINLDKKL